jgi:hypothetical protein
MTSMAAYAVYDLLGNRTDGTSQGGPREYPLWIFGSFAFTIWGGGGGFLW